MPFYYKSRQSIKRDIS